MTAPSTGSLHHHPPLTPAGVLLHGRRAAPLVSAAFLALAVVAAGDTGAWLRSVDEPVIRALVELRSPWLDGVVKTISALGGVTVVVAVAGLLLLLVWHQCRALAWTLLAATAARPLLEWALKELVDRPRPDLDRLVPGNGPSFPSRPRHGGRRHLGTPATRRRAPHRTPLRVVVVRGYLRHRHHRRGVQPRLPRRPLAH